MHRDNNMCPECRKTFKYNHTCPDCSRELIHLSHVWRVPNRKRLKEWKKFLALIIHPRSAGGSYTKEQLIQTGRKVI